MIVDAVYDNGRLLLPKQWRFAHKRFKVKVDLPEVEMLTDLSASETKNITQQPKPQSLQAELQNIYKDALTAADVNDDTLSVKEDARWASAEIYSSVGEEGSLK